MKLGRKSPVYDIRRIKTAILTTPPGSAAAGSDADTVDGFHADASPVANTLLALDGSALFPDGVIPSGIMRDAEHTAIGDASPHHVAVSIGAGGLSAKLSLSTQELTLAAIDHSDLSNISANEHIDHTGVTLTAGGGLTGGGTIAASRTFAVGAGNGIVVAADSVAVDLVSAWSGLEFSSGDLRVDLDAAFTWTAAHEFQAGATITAGQSLNFGGDVSLERGGVNILNIASGDAFRSSNFSSGVSGWAIAADGTAEFLNCFVRGELHAAVFVKDLIEARAGSMVIVKSAGTIDEDVAVPGAGTWTIDVTDPPGGGFLFANSDICRMKVEYSGGVGDIWFVVSGRVDNGDGSQRYTCTYSSGTRSITYPAGAPVLDYGVSGDGGILMTADLNNAPWISVFTHAGAPWTTTTSHLKIGNLNGEADYSSDEYGVFIGDYAGDSWLAYDPTNGLRLDGNAIIDGTISATMFTNDIGALFFSEADGLALWGPGCKLVSTGAATFEWTSTRGQVASGMGALHQGAGRWPETRGLVVERAGLNYEPAPRMIESGASGLAAGWSYWDGFGSGGSATKDIVVHPVTERGWLQRLTYTAAAGDVSDIMALYDLTAAGGFAQGDDVTISIDMKGNLSGCVLKIAVYEADAAGALGTLHQGSSISLTPSLQREECTFTTVDADCSRLRIYASYMTGVDDGDSFDVWVGAVNCEKDDHATSFMHGGLSWCAWSGTADASTSTRTVTQVNLDAHANLLSDNAAWSVVMWVQMPYDYNATWPETTYAEFFVVREGSTDYASVRFKPTDNKIYCDYMETGLHEASYQLAFNAGDWVHIAANFNTAGDMELFINGALRDTDDISSEGVIQPTEMNLGSWTDGSYVAGANYSELAIFDRVLTAAEVAALYYRNAPMIDAGALEKSGAFILDGRYSFASATTGEHTEITAAGIGIYDGTGPTSVGRILGGFVDTTAKELDIASDDLGWFGYDSSDVLQVAWYGSGANAGKILAGAGDFLIDADGATLPCSTSGNDNFIQWKDGANLVFDISSYKDTGGTRYLNTLRAQCPTSGYDSQIDLTAFSFGSADSASIRVASSVAAGGRVLIGGVDFQGVAIGGAGMGLPADPVAMLTISGDVRISRGLYVGSISVNPSTGSIAFSERSSDPTEPAEGNAVIWMSNGTGKGADGDVMIASKAGGTTKYATLFDHSLGNAW